MIVPMKKVALFIRGDERKTALENLRKLGVLHIEIAEGKGDTLNAYLEQISLLERSIFVLSEASKKKVTPQKAGKAEALKIAQTVADLTAEKKAIAAQKVALQTEVERLCAWGEVNPQEIERLAQKGTLLTLYEMPLAVYKKLNTDAKILPVKKRKGIVYFAVVTGGKEGENAGMGSPDTATTADGTTTPDLWESYCVELPIKSTAEMKEEIVSLGERAKAIDEEILSYGGYIESMKTAAKLLQKDVEFETYATGMSEETLRENADEAAEEGDTKKGDTLAYFSGYLPVEDVEKLKDAAKANAWGLYLTDPTVDDNAPTKLQNNKFVSLIYPLTDFLGTVPGYFEHDISGWFLGFILVFFGIIFGDGGYGLLILGGATALILYSLITKKQVPPAYILIAMMGGATIIWGALTCNWFALDAKTLPAWLQGLSIPFISNVNADTIWYPFWTESAGLTTAQNTQIFCFALALLQLTIAHILGAIRKGKTLKILGEIGSILQLFGMFYVVLSLVVNGAVFPLDLVIAGVPVGIVAILMVAVGFALTFVFSNYEGSVLQSILNSLKNIVSVLLGVVNVFSDIVSYIRLWAVGLAGSAIAATVNTFAGPFLGNFAFILVAIALLVFGHGLNMILNVLSVIVHGIRLNTLEFSSHLDITWGGHKYKPFEE